MNPVYEDLLGRKLAYVISRLEGRKNMQKIVLTGPPKDNKQKISDDSRVLRIKELDSGEIEIVAGSPVTGVNAVGSGPED